MIAAEYIAQYLVKLGVKTVFGYDGSMMLKVADEISLTNKIAYLQTFHEQGAGFAADAYARVSGELGVAIVTSGPGAINVLAGVADAYADSIPVLFITGQDYSTALLTENTARVNGFQDLKIAAVAAPITKYSTMITCVEDVAYELEKATDIALEGRKGPVLIDIPMDIQFAQMPEEVKHYKREISVEQTKIDIDKVLCALKLSKRPVILVGGGVRSANAVDEVEEFAKMLDIPVVTTLNGIDAYVESLGFSGLYGNTVANLAIYNADLLLIFGARMGQRQVGKKVEQYTNARIIHIDIDSVELGRVLKEDISIHSDLKEFLDKIKGHLDMNVSYRHISWNKTIKAWNGMYENNCLVNHDGIDPVAFVRKISRMADENTVFTNDVGQNQMWVCQGINLKKGQRLLNSSGYGSMGFSLPAAVGASIWNKDNLTVSFSGDGGFHMNMQELQFVAMYNLNIKCIVFNNNTLGMMREVQRLYYNNHFLGSNEGEFRCVNLKKLADVYDMRYFCIDSMKQCEVLEQEFKRTGPCIIECKVQFESYLLNRYDELDIIEKSKEVLALENEV